MRRRIAVAGVTGVALTLGAASYITTDTVLDRRAAVPEPVSLAPPAVSLAPPASTVEPTPHSAAVSASISASTSASGMPDDTSEPDKTRTRHQDTAQPDDNPHPTTKKQGKEASVADIPVETATEKLPNGTVQIMSGDQDLTGVGHLRWAGDEGRPIGSARCTQNFRFDPAKGPRRQPTMLLCWRITNKRSVMAMAYVRQNETPSTDSTVRLLEKHW
jgi:hypothetical protein